MITALTIYISVGFLLVSFDLLSDDSEFNKIVEESNLLWALWIALCATLTWPLLIFLNILEEHKEEEE